MTKYFYIFIVCKIYSESKQASVYNAYVFLYCNSSHIGGKKEILGREKKYKIPLYRKVNSHTCNGPWFEPESSCFQCLLPSYRHYCSKILKFQEVGYSCQWRHAFDCPVLGPHAAVCFLVHHGKSCPPPPSGPTTRDWVTLLGIGHLQELKCCENMNPNHLLFTSVVHVFWSKTSENNDYKRQ